MCVTSAKNIWVQKLFLHVCCFLRFDRASVRFLFWAALGSYKRGFVNNPFFITRKWADIIPLVISQCPFYSSKNRNRTDARSKRKKQHTCKYNFWIQIFFAEVTHILLCDWNFFLVRIHFLRCDLRILSNLRKNPRFLSFALSNVTGETTKGLYLFDF